MKVAIFFLALLVSWVVIVRNLTAIYNSKDLNASLTFALEITACTLWTLIIYFL
jgi:hypothetical protein